MSTLKLLNENQICISEKAVCTKNIYSNNEAKILRAENSLLKRYIKKFRSEGMKKLNLLHSNHEIVLLSFAK
jgi:hypothetical protein